MGLRALCIGAVRLSLLAFPASFRHRHGEDMLQLQRERLDEAARRGGTALLQQTMTGVADLIAAGFAERFGKAPYRPCRPPYPRATHPHRRPEAPEKQPRSSALDPRRQSAPLRGAVADLRLAAAALARQPAFLLLTVLPIALGIAAATTIFSVVNATFLRPLPYPDPARLRVVGSAWPREPESLSGLSVPNFIDLRAATDSFERLGLLMGPLALDRRHPDGTSERVTAARVTPELFDLLGARAAAGRLLQPGDGDAVVLSHASWMREWQGDPAAIGDTVVLAGERLTVVGVLSADFVPPEGLLFASRVPEFWAPLDVADPTFADARGFGGFEALGRLREGVDDRAAQQEVDAIAAALARTYPEANTRDGAARMIRLRSLHAYTVGDAAGRAFLLLGAVALILLISCLNVASMFLVRGHGRLGELSLRAALGAGYARLGRLVVAEGLAVAALGGLLGTALSYLGVEAFVALSPGDIPRLAEVEFDAGGLGFAFAASLVAVLLFATLPVLQAMRIAPAGVLQRSARGLSAPFVRTRAVLMAAEVALAVVLVSTTAMFLRGFIGMASVDRGFEPEGVLAVEISSADRDPVFSVQAFRAFAEAVRSDPDVQAVSAATLSLLAPMGGLWEAAVPPAEPTDTTWASVVLPDYFEALGIPLLAGQDFSWTDDLDTPATVIISESLARRLFGTEDPVGRELTLSDERLARATVIGVAADTLSRTEDGRFVPYPTVYISYLQRPWLSSMVFAVRYRGSLRVAADGARAAARRLGASVTLVGVKPLHALIAGTLVEPRFYSWLLSSFSLTALLLAAIGVYATLAFIVTGRRRELGIRVALGASPTQILANVLRYGLLIVAGGLAVGLPIAAWVSGRLDGLVTGIEAGGISAHAVTAAVLLLVGGAAALGPAVRAVRIDPRRVLSHDR